MTFTWFTPISLNLTRYVHDLFSSSEETKDICWDARIMQFFIWFIYFNLLLWVVCRAWPDLFSFICFCIISTVVLTFVLVFILKWYIFSLYISTHFNDKKLRLVESESPWKIIFAAFASVLTESEENRLKYLIFWIFALNLIFCEVHYSTK